MKAERWQQVEKLYHAALERSAEERAPFLAQACASDEELRRDVESLLAYEDQAEKFIESPALEVAAKMMAEEHGATVTEGQTISHYKGHFPSRRGWNGRSLSRRGYSIGAQSCAQVFARTFHSR